MQDSTHRVGARLWDPELTAGDNKKPCVCDADGGQVVHWSDGLKVRTKLDGPIEKMQRLQVCE
jgi:hypothetical protein